MKKIFVILLCHILFLGFQLPVFSAVIEGGISATDRVPTGFFGSWKVMAVRNSTTNPSMFAPYSVEIWNLSKNGDVITLRNPVSGAEASLSVRDATSDTFTFERVTGNNAEKVTEIAELTLRGDNFTGFDTMKVRTYKNGMVIKEEKVVYQLKAIKLSGADISRIFGIN